jgi:hypothetical protein
MGVFLHFCEIILMFGGVATVKVATPSASPIGDSRQTVAGSAFMRFWCVYAKKNFLQWKQGGGVTPIGFDRKIS